MDSAVSVKRSFKTRYRTEGLPYRCAPGKDSVFVCGEDADSTWYTVTHYSLVTGEERCPVKLNDGSKGMTTVLYDNRPCIAWAYW